MDQAEPKSNFLKLLHDLDVRSKEMILLIEKT